MAAAVAEPVLKLDPSIPPADPSMNIGPDGKYLVKPCCACPTTKTQRDECVMQYGQDDVRCADLVAAHRKCMEGFGFKV